MSIYLVLFCFETCPLENIPLQEGTRDWGLLAKYTIHGWYGIFSSGKFMVGWNSFLVSFWDGISAVFPRFRGQVEFCHQKNIVCVFFCGMTLLSLKVTN